MKKRSRKRTSVRRKSAGMSASPKRRSIKRYSRRKRKGLSEIFSPSVSMAGAKSIGAGALGGFIASAGHRLIKDQPPITRYGLELAGAFVTYALLGYPSMSSGMVGAFVSLESTKLMDGMLNDDADLYADPNAINQLPMMMNENGDAVTLCENNGDMVYLNERTGEITLAEDVYLQDGVTLAEDVYLQESTSIYPDYSTQY